MNPYLIAVACAVVALFAFIAYLAHVTGGDPIGYARRLEHIAAGVEDARDRIGACHGDDDPGDCATCADAEARAERCYQQAREMIPPPLWLLGRVLVATRATKLLGGDR